MRDPKRVIIYAIVFIMLGFAVAEIIGVSALNPVWSTFLGTTLAATVLALRSEKEEEAPDGDAEHDGRRATPNKKGGAPGVGSRRSSSVRDPSERQLRWVHACP